MGGLGLLSAFSILVFSSRGNPPEERFFLSRELIPGYEFSLSGQKKKRERQIMETVMAMAVAGTAVRQ